MKFATILTCFNRKEKTRSCLENLFKQKLPKGASLQVFICDDNSSDGTSEMLKNEFPKCEITMGDGFLYWGRGMRAAWEYANQSGKFDFFLWLNDDTFLLENALVKLIEDYNRIGKAAIITAACKKPDTEIFSYGGSTDLGKVIPNGRIQKVNYINGNLVLIPNQIFRKIGFNSAKYTHYLGDFDYGLRAQKEGFECYTSSSYLAECDFNSTQNWADPTKSFRERWKMVHNVKGRAISEYVSYKTYHYGKFNGLRSIIDTTLRLVFTDDYLKVRKKLFNK